MQISTMYLALNQVTFLIVHNMLRQPTMHNGNGLPTSY